MVSPPRTTDAATPSAVVQPSTAAADAAAGGQLAQGEAGAEKMDAVDEKRRQKLREIELKVCFFTYLVESFVEFRGAGRS
jgi:hypothetical protein